LLSQFEIRHFFPIVFLECFFVGFVLTRGNGPVELEGILEHWMVLGVGIFEFVRLSLWPQKLLEVFVEHGMDNLAIVEDLQAAVTKFACSSNFPG